MDEEQDPVYVALGGSNLSEAEAAALDARIGSDPRDVVARLQILGYWRHRGFKDPQARARCTEQVRWFIENDAEHEILASPFALVMETDPEYPAICAAWDVVIEKPDATPSAIYVAANFFRHADRERSHALLLRGAQVAPTWSCWSRELGGDLLRAVTVERNARDTGHGPRMSDVELREKAAQALEHYQQLLAISKSLHVRFENLTDCAEAAIECGREELARRYAEEALALAPRFPEERHRPDLVHEAHIILGRLALAAGDVDGARAALRAAGEQGSSAAPVLRSFGPDFHLARQLLAAGQREPVREYLDLCATFWRPRVVSAWRDELARGGTPRMDPYDPAFPDDDDDDRDDVGGGT